MNPDPEYYSVDAVLKRGRFTTVSLLMCLKTGDRVVARQVVPPTDDFTEIEELPHLADRLVALRHPGLQRTLGMVKNRRGIWFLSEFTPGFPLQAYAGQTALLSSDWILRWTAQMLSAIQYMHDHRFHLGYIDPTDVVINIRRAVIIDLRIFDHAFPEFASLMARTASPAFVAPELRLSTCTTTRSDVFTAGAVAFWMLTGTPPALHWHVEAGPWNALRAARPDLPPEAVTRLAALVNYYPTERPPTADAALDAIRPFLPEPTIEKPPLPQGLTLPTEADPTPWVPPVDRFRRPAETQFRTPSGERRLDAMLKKILSTNPG